MIDRSNIKYKIANITFIFYLLSFIFYLPPAKAQSLSLAINPPIIELMIKPGKSITQVFTLENNASPVIVTPRIIPFGQEGLIDDQSFISEPWIRLINKDVVLKKPILLPKSVPIKFVLEIKPPINAVEQDYYRALVFTTEPNPEGQNSQAQFSQSIGSIILIRVTSTGIFRQDAQIYQFTLPKIHDSFSPLKLNIDVKNTGESFFRPMGKINLAGPFGSGEFKIIQNIILVNQTKTIMTEQSSLSPHTDQFSLALPGFFLGKYQLSIDFTLDEGKVQITDSKTFYALPIKAIISIGIIIFIIISIRVIKTRKKEV